MEVFTHEWLGGQEFQEFKHQIGIFSKHFGNSYVVYDTSAFSD